MPLGGLAQQTQRGDVNGDGKVTISDVTLLIDILLNGDDSYSDDDWVDLGLPSGTIWATRNVGASSPEDYGDYFAWGDTVPAETYDWNVYKWCDGTWNTMTKYCSVDNKTELDMEDDAASVHYPGRRMPSSAQIAELINYCTYQWTQIHGVYGTLFTGPSGNTMFLPAAGYRGDYLSSAGRVGCYWSRTLSSAMSNAAYALYTDSSPRWNGNNRCQGLSVRAVRAQ